MVIIMLLALAALSHILVSVGAKECQCDSGLDDDCAIFMWGYFRATYRNLTWNDLMSKHADRRLQRGSVPPVEGYHPIFFSRSFDLGDVSPMEQKLHLTLYREQLPKENISSNAEFGCGCYFNRTKTSKNVKVLCYFR